MALELVKVLLAAVLDAHQVGVMHFDIANDNRLEQVDQNFLPILHKTFE